MVKLAALCWLIVITIPALASDEKPFAVITFKTFSQDSIELSLHKYGVDLRRYFSKVQWVKPHDGQFKMSIIETGSVEHIDVGIRLSYGQPGKRKILVMNFAVFKGDRLEFSQNGDSLVFSGKDSAFYSLQRMLVNSYNLMSHSKSDDAPTTRVKEIDESWKSLNQLFVANAVGLSKKKVALLKAELLLDAENRKFSYLREAMYKYQLKGLNQDEIKVSYKHSHSDTAEIEKTMEQMECDGNLQASTSYPRFVMERYYWDSCVVVNKDLNLDDRLDFVVKNFKGSVRDRLLLYLIENRGQNLFNVLTVAQEVVKGNSDFEEYVSHERMSVGIGQRFFDFNLPDVNGKLIKLDDFKGKVVLVDFWYTGCGNCRAIHPYLDSIKSLLPQEKFELVTISIDEDKNQWFKSIGGGKYTTPETTNLYTAGLGLKHPLIQFYQIYLYPALFLLDKNGIMKNPPPDPRGDRGAALMAAIKNAFY